MGLVASLNLELKQLDVKIAFLHDDLDEEIYMVQTENFKVKGKKQIICKLKNSLHGLKQALRQWCKKFYSFMMGHDYTQVEANHCVYTREFYGSNFIILLLYVDEMLTVRQDM